MASQRGTEQLCPGRCRYRARDGPPAAIPGRGLWWRRAGCPAGVLERCVHPGGTGRSICARAPRMGARRAVRGLFSEVRIFFAVPRSAWVDLNLRRSLEDMGHELVRFDFPGWPDEADADWQRFGKPRTNERLLSTFRAALRQGPLDLFFGYFYSSVVFPET